MTETDPLIGRDFAGRYRVEALIGKGGMGHVYRAVHVPMDKRVALKVLAPELAGDPENADRFEREAAASATLKHPHTIQIFDYGADDEGRLYLAMELLEGFDLGQVLSVERAFAPARAVRIVSQVLKSLREAHAHGIVHRDLKPENVFLTEIHGEPDYVKVLDFGIAKFLNTDRIKQTLTQAGLFCGTPLYMAPEQGLGYAVTPATDIYSVGIMLWELLAGATPFTAEDPVAVVMMQIHRPVPPLPDPVRAAIPEALQELLAAMTDKAPSRRPADAGEVLRRLRSIDGLAEEPPSTPPTEDEARPEPEPPPTVVARRRTRVPPEDGPSRGEPGATLPATPMAGGGGDLETRLDTAAPPPRSRSRLLDLLTILLGLALVLAGVLVWNHWQRGGAGDAQSQETCVEACLEQGYDRPGPDGALHVPSPDREECEEHCAASGAR